MESAKPGWNWLSASLAIIVCLLAVSASCAWGKEMDPRMTAEASDRVKELRVAIVDDAKALGTEHWAGEYYHGDGLGVNVTLAISPKSGFAFEWRGCMGVYDRNYGTVAERKDTIVLTAVFPNRREGFRGIPTEFVPLKWGERRYLIPADDIVGFCNQINSGREPRERLHGNYLLRKGDEKKKATGNPELPPGFGQYLLSSPLHAKIVEVGAVRTRDSRADWKFHDTEVTLNIGSKDGVAAGMTLHVIAPQNVSETARIMRVEEQKSTAIITQIGEKRAVPTTDWELSTRLRYLPQKRP